MLDNDALVHWDRSANVWFHLHATATGLSAFDAITQIGLPGVWIVFAIVAILLWYRRHLSLLILWLAANLGGALIDSALKILIHRARPQYAAVYLRGHSYSFPSGHTMGSTICYLVLAFILAQTLIWTGPRRILAYVSAALLILLIGFSRLYLSVHYPSDVLGGLIAGAAWVVACLTVYSHYTGPSSSTVSPRRY